MADAIEAKLDADVEAMDAEVKAWLDVGVSLGKSVDANTAAQQLANRLQQNTPITRRFTLSGTYPASGNLQLQLQTGPDTGTYWDVENVVVGGTDINVTAAGTSGLYVLAAQTGSSPGLGNAVDYASSLPNVGFYGFRDIVVNDGEFLSLVIFGGTAAQQYVAQITVSVYNTWSAGGKQVNIAGA